MYCVSRLFYELSFPRYRKCQLTLVQKDSKNMFKRLTTTLKLVHLKYNCQLQGFHIGEVFLHWYFSRILTILIFKASYQLICWVDLFLLIPGRFYFCLFLLKKNHFLKNNYFMCKIFKYFLQFFSKCIIFLPFDFYFSLSLFKSEKFIIAKLNCHPVFIS